MIQRDDQGRIVNVHTDTKTVVQHVHDRSVIANELVKARQAAADAQAKVEEIEKDLADFDQLANNPAMTGLTNNAETNQGIEVS